jgi:hypothetical protein
MEPLDRYLEEHAPEIKQLTGAEEVEETLPNVFLTGTLLGVSVEHILFGHLLRQFLIRKQDVVSISDARESAANLFGTGRLVDILLRPHTKLRSEVAVDASTINNGVPFSIAMPSGIHPQPITEMSLKETAWRQNNCLPLASVGIQALLSVSAQYCPVATNVNTQSWSGGTVDDMHNDQTQDGQYDGQQVDD